MATTTISSNQTVTAAAGATATYNFASGSSGATLVLDLVEGKKSTITITGSIGTSYKNILKLISSSSAAIDTSDSYVTTSGTPSPVVNFNVNTQTTTINIYDSQKYLLATITLSGDPFNVVENYTQFGTQNGVTTYQTSLAKIGFTTSNGAVSVCYLAGSLVRTPSGSKCIEEMEVGDTLLAYEGGVEKARRVVWVGRAHCNVRRELHGDEAGYPIRILKSAISDGVPFKDMLITPEHCLFFDGKFIPARMLVNGRSIFYDTSIISYDYYHIETEDHSVITVDGVLTESYLDTGNRPTFQEIGSVVTLGFGGAKSRSWASDAAAPLDTSRNYAEPLFRELETRAIGAGFELRQEPQALTYDTDLHLVVESGAIVRKLRSEGNRIMFMIPPGVSAVRLISNTSRPCDVRGPFVDDRRYFGVCVGKIEMFEKSVVKKITDHLTTEKMDGWNVIEGGNDRWTTGDAILPLSERHPNACGILTVEVTHAGPYAIRDEVSENLLLKA
ncbi:Hint domain-containing protein [Acetobacter sacchari]|uniref:Hint domain-containing protein n=1 Tax=Acetobacter sacchari TaxID=2661687 RepID=A0ABS3LWV7_9PROT|nr:Hint domain-containing protein [Acetobacter sacchari]MBO1360403.1 Hint domain-containing protein [Acetobacter sacchari]